MDQNQTMRTCDTLLLSAADGQQALQKAGQLIRQGGLVAFPTETVYGLGANALDPQAVRGIFAAKGRPQDNPLIIHLEDASQTALYAKHIPPVYYRLCEQFSPGPLTIIHWAGVPVAAPSANLSGSPSPTTAEHCVNDLWGRVDAIVDGGACSVGLESTVLSLAGEHPVLLRPGAVTPQMLRPFLPDLQLHEAITHKLREGQTATSPGMKYKHYAPKAQITILDADSREFVEYVNHHREEGLFALCFEEDLAGLQVPAISLGADDEDQARRLFAALRELDRRGAKKVYARCPDKDGVGLAVYNRLIRAAAYHEQSVDDPKQERYDG